MIDSSNALQTLVLSCVLEASKPEIIYVAHLYSTLTDPRPLIMNGTNRPIRSSVIGPLSNT